MTRLNDVLNSRVREIVVNERVANTRDEWEVVQAGVHWCGIEGVWVVRLLLQHRVDIETTKFFKEVAV